MCTEHPDTSNMNMCEHEWRQVTPGSGGYGHALMYSYALSISVRTSGLQSGAVALPPAEPMRPCTHTCVRMWWVECRGTDPQLSGESLTR